MKDEYWVFEEGVARGPHGMDELEELHRRGELSADTVVRLGEQGDWVRADSIPELHALLASSTPRTVVMSSSERGAGARRVPRWALITGAGLGAGAVTFGLMMAILPSMMSGDPAISRAVLSEGMPSQVESIVVGRALEDRESETERALADSWMATFCGGVDLGAELLKARGREPAALAGDGTLGLLARTELRDELTCGARIAEAGASHIVMLTFGDGDVSRSVVVMTLGEMANPPFPQRHNFSGLEGRCHPAEEKPGECAQHEDALVRRGDEWAFGTAADVAAYARQWNRGAERSETTQMEYARLLGASLERDAAVTMLWIRPEVLPFGMMCESVPGGVERCMPRDVDDTSTRIRAQTRGVSVQVRRPRRALVDPSLRWVMSFATRDEKDAEDVARELEALLQDWRAHLENNESVLIDEIREADGRDADHEEAMLRGFVRALQDASVEIDGRIARVVAEAELSDAEQREVRAYLAEVQKERDAAARVVQAVRADAAPQRDDLGALVGEQAADWMLAPRTTEASCAALRERVEAFAASGIETAEFGAHFRLQRRFAEDRCVGRVTSGESHACLEAAASIAEMDRCPLALPPWERQPFEQTVRGELTDDDTSVRRRALVVDAHPVEVDAGWIISAELESEELDPLVILFDPDGDLAVTEAGTRGGPSARIEHVAASGGRYSLNVTSTNYAGRGRYSLRITARPGVI